MADQDPDDAVMKERDTAGLAGNEDAIRTPGDATAMNGINQMAFTYPRVDAPGDLARGDPHTIREFKAFPVADEQCKDTMMNDRLRVPGRSGDPQRLEPAHRRQATEKKALDFKKLAEVFESPLLDFHYDLFEQCKAQKDLGDNEGSPRGGSGPFGEEKQTVQGSRKHAYKSQSIFGNSGTRRERQCDQNGGKESKDERKKETAILALSDSTEQVGQLQQEGQDVKAFAVAERDALGAGG